MLPFTICLIDLPKVDLSFCFVTFVKPMTFLTDQCICVFFFVNVIIVFVVELFFMLFNFDGTRVFVHAICMGRIVS